MGQLFHGWRRKIGVTSLAITAIVILAWAIHLVNQTVANFDRQITGALEKSDSEAIRIDVNNADAYVDRGFAFLQTGEYGNAIKEFTEAIRLDPNDSDTYGNRGFALRQTGDHENAIKDYTESIRLDPNNSYTYVFRGFALQQRGDHENAIKDFTEAIRLDPKRAIAYRNRGYISQLKGKFHEAINDWTEAIKIDQTVPTAYLNLACLKASCPNKHMRNGNEVVEYATKACELTKWSDWYALSVLSRAYAEVEDFDRAIEWAEKSMKLAPEANKPLRIDQLELFRDRKALQQFGKPRLKRAFL